MMELKSSEVSLVCQFNFKYDNNELDLILISSIEVLFSIFNFTIKKICLSSIHGKIYRISHKKLNSILNDLNNEFKYINFRSDYNSGDFEPNTRFYVQLNKFKGLLKVSVIIKEQHLFDNDFDMYKTIVEELSKSNSYSFTGYSFYIPNYYGPVSFSFGILRRTKMPKDMLNLAQWYTKSNLIKSTIGYLNCFSNLSEYQIQFLIDTFGSDNVSRINNATIFRCNKAFLSDDASYFDSVEYAELCDKFEQELPFVRNQYDSFL